jgi:ABC-2 type transport system ATP-binding protein
MKCRIQPMRPFVTGLALRLAVSAKANATMSTPATTTMIEANGLCKYYDLFAAIEDISFSIPAGQVCAFLGPNGAGKSTTMKILTGFLSPSSGSASIGGFDVYRNRIEAARLIGYLPENGPLYVEMTPASLLRYLGKARGMSAESLKDRLAYVAEKCHLAEVWGKPIAKLSRGFRQRVGMAHALLHDPAVLILDEPTSGLDPNQVFEVRELIRGLGKTKTILLSTHILQEVQAVASRALLVNEGRLVFDGTISELASSGHDLDSRFRELTASK